jgi:hypothetical protein
MKLRLPSWPYLVAGGAILAGTAAYITWRNVQLASGPATPASPVDFVKHLATTSTTNTRRQIVSATPPDATATPNVSQARVTYTPENTPGGSTDPQFLNFDSTKVDDNASKLATTVPYTTPDTTG